jgi:hypothetical protein
MLIAAGCARYLFRPLSWLKCSALWTAGLLLLVPARGGPWLIADTVGFILGVGVIVWEWTRARQTRSTSAQPSRAAR